MRGYEIIARAVAETGTDTVFGVAGDANLYLLDDLVRSQNVRYIGSAHEAGAVMMAIGYARATNTAGVASVTHGPAVTNTATALVEGVRSHTPMVLLAGDTDPDTPDHPQNLDQSAFIAATGAGFEPIRSLAKVADDVARAFWRARAESRPIVLNMTSDLQWAEGEARPLPDAWPLPQRSGPDPAALDRALGIIASANRPLIVAGRGAMGARDELIALGDRLGAAMATSLLGAGLFRGEAYDIGVFGTLSHAGAGEVMAEADCIIGFGASLNTYTTDAGRLLAGKRLVHCDINPTAFGRYPRADAHVIGDSAAIATAMTAMLEAAEHRPSALRSAALAERLAARAWIGDYADRGTEVTIDPRTFTEALDRAVPIERTVAVDVGRFMRHALQLSVPEPTAMVTTHGFQSIGLGTGAAVGAGVGRPDRPVVLAAGDGGFMMGGLAEFQTAVRSGVDLIAVIYNDGSYGAEHVQFYRKGMDPSLSLNDWPDLAVVATALGGTGITVTNNGDLEAMTKAIATRDRPLLIDVHLDPEVASDLMG